MAQSAAHIFHSSRGPWHVYLICEEGREDAGPCKVGTAFDVARRLTGLRHGNWRPLVLITAEPLNDRHAALAVERRVQQALAVHRIHNRDWFRCAPALVWTAIREAIHGSH